MDFFPQDSELPELLEVTPAAPLETVVSHKLCTRCGGLKPVSEFLRRTGKRSGKASRRGTCKACRKQLKTGSEAAAVSSAAASGGNARARTAAAPAATAAVHADTAAVSIQPPAGPKRTIVRRPPTPPPRPAGPDASILRPNRQGILQMRGRTDKGRRWQQETDLETAVTLVREHAAVVVNRHTIRRVYSNRTFRSYILTRDRYTCYFCGEYGDTIDHLLPRAKGGHTTPVNCVCACSLCNQTKASLTLDEFYKRQLRKHGTEAEAGIDT